MANEINPNNVIDLRDVVRKVMTRRKLFYKVLPTVFVLSCLYIVCIPRTYDTNCALAPEIANPMSGGTLSSIASSFGIDLSQMETNDAITPLLYPDLMSDNAFVTNLFPVKVTTLDNELSTTYYDYLRYHQKAPWWTKVTNWLTSQLKSLFTKKQEGGEEQFNPYRLSKTDSDVANMIRDNVSLSVDKKTGVITVSVKDQDALICKTIADSVSAHLLQFIIDYRTNKAHIDADYYEQLTAKAKAEYDEARRKYSRFVDANQNVVLQSYRSQSEDLESDMQLKYNAYSMLSAQMLQAQNKVQERTPAFTLLKGADVPVKPSSPKRMIFVAAMLVLAFFATIAYIFKEEFLSALQKPQVQA